MGKRSRKRDPRAKRAPVVANERPARGTPDRRARLDELPKPPWAPFPLVELCVLMGLVLIGIGLFGGSDRRGQFVLAGVALAAVAGLEQAVREHFAGFRSHTTLIAGSMMAMTIALTSVAGLGQLVALAIALGVGATAWPMLRSTFVRRSGGLSFRA